MVRIGNHIADFKVGPLHLQRIKDLFLNKLLPRFSALQLNNITCGNVHQVVVEEARTNRLAGLKVFEPVKETIVILGSPGRLTQVITNLISNAIDANLDNNGSNIFIDLNLTNSHVLIIIRDEGPGIKPEILSTIFDPMFTTKPIGKGTGLGLAVVQDIMINEFQGTINVESPSDYGAVFTLTFPLLEKNGS